MNKVYGYDTNIYETSIGNIKNMNEEMNCVYSSNGVTTMSTKQYNNYIEIINNLKQEKDHYKHLYSEVKKQKDDVVELCNKSIKSVNDRLAWVDTKKSYPNEYQRVRLKAFRTKCKEILRLLGECNE